MCLIYFRNFCVNAAVCDANVPSGLRIKSCSQSLWLVKTKRAAGVRAVTGRTERKRSPGGVRHKIKDGNHQCVRLRSVMSAALIRGNLSPPCHSFNQQPPHQHTHSSSISSSHPLNSPRHAESSGGSEGGEAVVSAAHPS